MCVGGWAPQARGALQAVVGGPSTSRLESRERLMSVACVFCQIVRGAEPASVVWEDELTMAFLDRRQFHPGHTLVIPRQHLCDVGELDHKTGAALMDAVARRIFSARRATRSEGKLNEER